MKKLVPTSIGTIAFSPKKTSWFYLLFTCCFFINFTSISLGTIIATSLITLITVSLGHSIGLHRGVIHKSYKTSPIVQNILLYLFIFTGLGSPLNWLKSHYYRDYWQNRTDCPPYFGYQHSLFKDYWWYLHLEFRSSDDQLYQIPSADLNNRWINWLHHTWVFHIVLAAVITYYFTSFNTVLLLFPFRMLLTHLGHWHIGYASHKFGYSRYEIDQANESGYNDVILGLISFGEGLHNNHHGHPSSAKFSHAWYEIDISWYFIQVLEKMRIIWEVNRPVNHKTLKRTAKILSKNKWNQPSIFHKRTDQTTI